VSVPIRSGTPWIDLLFDDCVRLLLQGAKLLGTSYNAINIWVFCVIWPLLTLLLAAIVLIQFRIIRRMKGERERGLGH